MAGTCKKHGKPRTVIVERKMPRGGTFSFVGCADCASGASAKEKPRQEKKPKESLRSSVKVRSY
jgi:hypothetical protein